VVRLRASFPDGVLLVPRAPDIRYDGLLPIGWLCFTDQTGDTAASIADAMPTSGYRSGQPSHLFVRVADNTSAIGTLTAEFSRVPSDSCPSICASQLSRREQQSTISGSLAARS